ncbi:MAG: YwaF family protein [Erysipelotrichaceae bacterium]|nr:YwaF family protein [Erysipelotrichaceae bacterium]
MGITFSKTPKLFGTIHISALILTFVLNVIFYFLLKNKDKNKLLKILHYLGTVMILAEVFKQWFCYVYVFNRTLNLWFFPWQLCSMAMYCSFIAIYLKDKKQEAVLVFLTTYSLLADIIALALPYDMLRDQVILTLHSFIYHGLIITEAIIALLILKEKEKASFLPATLLFLLMALIAEIINVISHSILNNIYIEPNMFYITLAYETTQPIFHEIALRFGIIAEIIFYLSMIILGSYLIFVVERKIFKK